MKMDMKKSRDIYPEGWMPRLLFGEAVVRLKRG